MHTIRRNMDDFYGSDDDRIDAAFLSAVQDPAYDGCPIEICLPDRPLAWKSPHVFSMIRTETGIVLKPGEGASLHITEAGEHPIPASAREWGGMSDASKYRIQVLVVFLSILWTLWRMLDLGSDGATPSEVIAMVTAVVIGSAVCILTYRVLWGHWPWSDAA
jgi:hypothetical protein